MEDTIIRISILAVPILLAVTVHEVAHGWAASKLGDDTARLAGRLTLNPIKHLDLVGTLVFLVTQMVGWAKPVPVNPYNFRNPRQDMLWVSAAGPGANLILAGLFAVIFRGISGNVIPLPEIIAMRYQVVCAIRPGEVEESQRLCGRLNENLSFQEFERKVTASAITEAAT